MTLVLKNRTNSTIDSITGTKGIYVSYSNDKVLIKLIAIFSFLTIFGLMFQAQAQNSDQDNFSGIYVGGEAGYANEDEANLSVNGAYYGGFVGARDQMGKLVYGGELFAGSTTLSFEGAKIDLAYGFDGMIGTPISNKILIFANVGYGRFRVTSEDPSDTQGGVRFGGGFETKLGNQISLRLKAIYTKLDDADIITASGGILFQF